MSETAIKWATAEAGDALNIAIAERVFGLHTERLGDAVLTFERADLSDEGRLLEDYSNLPAADYTVLEHVRRTWDPTQVCKVRDALGLMWDQRAEAAHKAAGWGTRTRVVWGCTQYLPGDYARAALIAQEADR